MSAAEHEPPICPACPTPTIRMMSLRILAARYRSSVTFFLPIMHSSESEPCIVFPGRSSCQAPAIDVIGLAGHVAGGIGAQHQHHPDDFFRKARPPHGD